MATKRVVVDLEKDAQMNGLEDEFDALFDSWDEAAEDAAIAKAAEAADVRYIIVEGKTFVARFPDGMQLQLPLRVSLADIQSIAEVGDEMEQAKLMLEMFGGPEDVAKLEQQNLPSTVVFVEKYFRVFQKISQAALGK